METSNKQYSVTLGSFTQTQTLTTKIGKLLREENSHFDQCSQLLETEIHCCNLIDSIIKLCRTIKSNNYLNQIECGMRWLHILSIELLQLNITLDQFVQTYCNEFTFKRYFSFISSFIRISLFSAISCRRCTFCYIRQILIYQKSIN